MNDIDFGYNVLILIGFIFVFRIIGAIYSHYKHTGKKWEKIFMFIYLITVYLSYIVYCILYLKLLHYRYYKDWKLKLFFIVLL